MRHESEQHSPRKRSQKREQQFIQLIGHHGQKAEKEKLNDTLAFHIRTSHAARKPSKSPPNRRLPTGAAATPITRERSELRTPKPHAGFGLPVREEKIRMCPFGPVRSLN